MSTPSSSIAGRRCASDDYRPLLKHDHQVQLVPVRRHTLAIMLMYMSVISMMYDPASMDAMNDLLVRDAQAASVRDGLR
ncbi:MAG: hypothetical protein MZU97_27240 [Bacillus subtilis]|nr:hypothetical protein [Bacillus subtilis]